MRAKRKLVFAANWKMHKSPAQAQQFIEEFRSHWPEILARPQVEVVLFPPAVAASLVAATLRDSPVQWGAQNTYFEKEGAFTGENSPAVMAELGARYVLVGHSERRALFGEADPLLAKKVAAIQSLGLIPLLCVGETLKEREAGTTREVLSGQLREGLTCADFQKPLAIAYEPVWAIGTGRVATPDLAEAAHTLLRDLLAQLANLTIAQQTPILYGGSAKPDNVGALIEQPSVDGFLVGGASLDPHLFAQLCRVALERLTA